MRTKLIVSLDFIASHSLSGFETPHPHLWKCEVMVTGQPVEGRIIDLLEFSNALKSMIAPIQDTYLNECSYVDEQARAFPTAETVGASLARTIDEGVLSKFRVGNPSVQLLEVKVSLCSPQGELFGTAITEV